MKSIAYVNLSTSQKRDAIPAILSRMDAIAREANWILGGPVAEFESAFAREVGGTCAVGVNSGLDALLLALRSLGIGPGDEVITSPVSFVATAAAIHLTGARTVFSDVGENGNLDPACVRTQITPRTRALLPVHWGGIPCDMDSLVALGREYGIPVVVDAAQAVGTTLSGKRVAEFGDLVCFSLHPLKNLAVWGDGGVVVARDSNRADWLRQARNHGLRNRDECDFFSHNSRLDTIQAVVGIEALKGLNTALSARRRHADRYLERLRQAPGLRVPLAGKWGVGAGVHLFQVLHPRRQELMEHLAGVGVESRVHYPIPLHLQSAAKSLGYVRGDFPKAELFCAEVLSLPVREDLTDAEVDYVCDQVLGFCRQTQP